MTKKQGTAMITAYRIRDWARHFENSETRKLKHLRWIPVPNQHDGAGFRALWENFPASPEVFGGFILLLELASRCPERGLLVKDGRAMTTREMALKTGAPESLFATSLQVLMTEEIGWIESVEIEIPGNLPTPPETSGTKGIEGKGREGNTTARPPALNPAATRPADNFTGFEPELRKGNRAAIAEAKARARSKEKEAVPS